MYKPFLHNKYKSFLNSSSSICSLPELHLLPRSPLLNCEQPPSHIYSLEHTSISLTVSRDNYALFGNDLGVNNSINNWLNGFEMKHFRHVLATSIFEHASTIEINNNKTLFEAMQSALAKVQHILGHRGSTSTLHYIDPRIIYILSGL